MRILTVTLLAIIALTVPAGAFGQSIAWPRGDRLTARLDVDTISFVQQTSSFTIDFTVGVIASSEQSARIIGIQASVPITGMLAPVAPPKRWLMLRPRGSVHEDSLALWGAGSSTLDVQPGQNRAGYRIVGTGLPGIVDFWVEGRYAEPTVSADSEEQVQDPPRIQNNGFHGMTVSIAAVVDTSIAALASRLQALRQGSCDLGWVLNQPTCDSLAGRITAVIQSVGNADSTRAALDQLRADLNAARPGAGNTLSANAYWLLRSNAEYLSGRLQ